MPYDFDQIIDRHVTESSKWHAYRADVLPLWIADMDFMAPKPVLQALHSRIDHGIFGYGRAQPEFSDLIVDRLQRLYNWHVSPDAVVLLPGVIAGFNLACRAVTTPGDGVLLQTPLYPPMLRVPGNIGLYADTMTLTQQSNGRYVIDFDMFATTIQEHTRVFILCNPHNPVGRVYTQSELEQMAESCLRHDIIICADEIHCDLLFPGHTHVPIASLAPEIAARTITFMAPSKTFNLPGLHCAFAVIPEPTLRETFQAARVDLVHRMVNILGQTAAITAYREGQPWLDELRRYLATNCETMYTYMQTQLPGVTMTRPEGTYLAWLDCRRAGIPGDDPYTFFLQKANVGLNDGKAFGPGGAGFVRLNFGCPRSLLQQALRRMREALQAL